MVIISSNDHPRVIRRAQQFGAAGFIPSPRPPTPWATPSRPCWTAAAGSPPMAAERSEADAELAARLAQLTLSSSACCSAWPMGLLNNRSRPAGPGREHGEGAVTAILKSWSATAARRRRCW